MGSYISEEDMENIAKNITKESLKKGCLICLICFTGMRLFIYSLSMIS